MEDVIFDLELQKSLVYDLICKQIADTSEKTLKGEMFCSSWKLTDVLVIHIKDSF